MTRRLGLAVPTVLLALALAACGKTVVVDSADTPQGSGSPSVSLSESAGTSPSGDGDAATYAQSSGDQIDQDVRAALRGATSMHIAGSVINSGDQTDVDLSLDTSGNCTGTIGEQGFQLSLLGVGGDIYFKAPRSFWATQDPGSVGTVWPLVEGKWVKMPASGSEDLTKLCNLTQFVGEMISGDMTGKDLTVVGPSTFQGQPTVQVKGTTDDGTSETAEVLATSPHYPVRMDAGSSGELTLSDFDKPLAVKAPADGEVFDLGSMG